MARLSVDFFSQELQLATSMDVIIPESTSIDDIPVLYLLHGLSDDHTIWVRRTSVERYAAAYGIALVMPAVGRSYYTDMESGPRYWSFVSNELPALIRRMFRLAYGRERTFIAGLSMGGYGALKMALTFPDRFAGVGAFSGALDPLSITERFSEGDDSNSMFRATEFKSIFGDPPNISETGRDLVYLTTQCVDAGLTLPGIYISCGSEDMLIEQNRRFVANLDRVGISHEYREEPGNHEWGFWDRHVKQFLEWLESSGLIRRSATDE